jgi:RNA polymerase sigma-70 factor (ECF subfamily)
MPGTDDDFAAFYAAAFRGVTANVAAWTDDPAEVRDLAQEAFVRALERWGRVSRLDDPRAWVCHVARNLATSRWRSLRRLRSLAPRLAEPDRHDDALPEPELLAAVRALPAPQREVIAMHYFADLPVAAIAAQLGAPEGTVKARLSRGRDALAVLLRPEETAR